MTDQMDNNDGNGSTSFADGEPTFGVVAQFIKDLSFESPNMVRILAAGGGGTPEVQMNLGVAAGGVGPDMYEVTLSVRAEAKRGELAAFIVELAYSGVFRLSGIPQEQMEPLLFIEAPRLLFPFARSIVADLTRESGFAPLMLNPIDFVDLYRTKLAERQAQAAAQAPLPEFPN